MQLAREAAPGLAGDGEPPGPRLENLTLWERVHEHLREEILSNRLPPGTDLSEVALARQLGVSRGPLREAIGRLAAEGLVTVRPRRGAIVRSLSREEFLEAYQVREALEALAVQLAVPRLGPDDFDLLEGLNAAMQRAADADEVEAFFEANAAFHSSLVDAAGNRRLAELYGQLLGQMGRYRSRSVMLRGNLQRSVVEHRAIVRAARRGDVERAARLMSEHVRVPLLRIAAEAAGQHEAGVLADAAAGEARR
jgi:DNA-binding GntR family transcriptional regulator